MCHVNSYNEEKPDFTTTRLLPRPCAQWLADEDRLLLIVLQQAIPPARGGRTCNSGFDTVDVVNSNIIVRLLEEAKSQAQPEHGSCERSRGAVPWSTSQALA